MNDATSSANAMPADAMPRMDPAYRLWELWRRGLSPDVREFLAQHSDLSLTQCVGALRVDQQERWLRGDRVSAEDYLQQCFFLHGQEEHALDLVYGEFLLRERLGESPELAEYEQRFPQFAGQFRLQIELRRALFFAPEDHSTPPASLEFQQRLTTPQARGNGGEGALPAVPGYEVNEVLGRGGMGVVYRAWQRGLKRQVALKMLRGEDVASGELLARFRAESAVLAQLRHPNIVQIFEVGAHEDRPYFAMELVEGGSLDQQTAGAPQPARAAAALVATVAQAIQHAHERGIVHRDLKPQNVLLAEDGTPKITDFGLAKLVSVAPGLSSLDYQTHAGAIVGTPSYMAPEQIDARAGATGAAADVYALGAILYELLTGRPPFQGATVLETLEQVRSAEPVPPRQLQPKLPRDLDTICLKCLAKEPGGRYASARELAEELTQFLAHRPIKARPLGTPARVGRWCRRNPFLAAVSGLAMLSLLAVLGVTVWFAIYQARSSMELRAALAEATAERRQANRLTARLALDRGQALGERGDVATGLLWLARSLESATQGEDDDLQRAVRLNLDSWGRQLHPLQGALAYDQLVLAAAFSPDGRLILTGSADQTARLWDVQTRKPVGPPLQHQGWVFAVAFSPDGKTLLTGSASPDGKQGEARFWDAETGKPKGPPLKHPGPVYRAAFSPTGEASVTLSPGPEVWLWQGNTGQPTRLALRHDGGVRAVAFSPDGHSVLTGSLDRTARLWDTATGRPVDPPLSHAQPVTAVAFSPDGEEVLTGSGPTAQRWKRRTGQQVGPPLHHSRPVRDVVFGPDGTIAITSTAESVLLWEAATGRPRGGPLRHQGEIVTVALSPDRRVLATTAKDKTGRLWDVATGTPAGSPIQHPSDVLAITFSPDGRTLLTTSLDETNEATLVGMGKFTCATRFWALDSARVSGIPLTQQKNTTAAAFSRDSRYVVAAGEDRTARVWEVATGKPVGPPLSHPGEVRAAVFAPGDRPTVLTVSYDPAVQDAKVTRADGRVHLTSKGKSIRSWDPTDGKLLGAPRPLSGVLHLVFSPTGQTLVTANVDNTTQLREARTGSPVGAPLRHEGPIMALAFTTDGRTILTGGLDKTVRLWDATTGAALGKAATQPHLVAEAALDGDRRTFCTLGMDRQVRLWDAATGRALGAPLPHPRTVAVALSPDGRMVLTGGEDGTARLWDTATGRPVGPPWPHPGPVGVVVFSPCGRTALIGGRGGIPRLWALPTAVSGTPGGVSQWVQSLTRREMTPTGEVRLLSAANAGVGEQGPEP